MSKDYWIIDTDAGVDDCQALALAFSCQDSHNFEVLAITVLAGNVLLPQAIMNIAETLKACNKENIPFYIGADRPLISTLTPATHIHGVDGLNNYWQREGKSREDHIKPQSKSAVQAIIDLAHEYSGNINIVTIGPLTNLALAACQNPEIISMFKRVLVMGGAVHYRGNRYITNEFNIWCDPEAAHIIFERFPSIELVPWETCIDKEHLLDLDFLRSYISGTSRVGKFIGEITAVREGRTTVHFCDPLTLAVAIDRNVVVSGSKRKGVIELKGTTTRGMTLINWGSSDMEEINEAVPNLFIVEKVNMEIVKQMLLSSIN
ncbi:unnamed protein product [Blepharisma stoltei]|uniref:Inosine/uridine-preferring nucleoside hydrolase domain-containing protein n=1 Tax=Blepharisma stoltei TaxID=1481888 RepID=A0AAU9J7I7_9CILI|nr:unnamed protein product [Blepharisma stoltei]